MDYNNRFSKKYTHIDFRRNDEMIEYIDINEDSIDVVSIYVEAQTQTRTLFHLIFKYIGKEKNRIEI